MKINERLLESLATDVSRPDKAGYLYKKGEVNKGFQRRYFVLRGNLLFYFEKEQDKTPIGVIVLENCHVELCSTEQSRFAFQIIFSGSGTRRYVLAADENEEMLHWMTRITHAGFDYMQSLVEDLEKRLEKLQKAESEMVSDSDTNHEQEVPSCATGSKADISPPVTVKKVKVAEDIINPLPGPFNRSKYKTMPVKKPMRKDKMSAVELGNRWSTMNMPKGDGELPEARPNWVDFSERTDFLCDDSTSLNRRFSINDFTPPSFMELKRHEQLEDNALISLDMPQSAVQMHETALPNSVVSRIKGNRRVKSERHRHALPMQYGRKTIGMAHGHSRTPPSNATTDYMSEIQSGGSESHFQYLHRLWGASIWVKVREFEVRHGKVLETGV